MRGESGPLNWMKGATMTKEAENTYVYRSDAIQAVVEWKPLLDDQEWSRGPNYQIAPEATVDVWPHFHTNRGKVMLLIPSYKSPRLAQPRPVWAYLPAAYEENPGARFPVAHIGSRASI